MWDPVSEFDKDIQKHDTDKKQKMYTYTAVVVPKMGIIKLIILNI